MSGESQYLTTGRKPSAIVDAILLSSGDNAYLFFGADNDVAVGLNSAGLAANTALTDSAGKTILIGTPVAQAIAANSLIISNITANGDVAMYGNLGGNSQQFFFYDTSASKLFLMPTGLVNIGVVDATDTTPLQVRKASAGAVTLDSYDIVAVENVDHARINIVTPADKIGVLAFSSPTTVNRGWMYYDHGSDTMQFKIKDIVQANWTDGAFAFQQASTISTSTGLLTITAASSLQLQWNVAQEISAWGNTAGTGRTYTLRGSNATDGLANDSPTFVLAAYYDADPTGGLTNTAWNYSIAHDMITAGATPKSQAVHSINSVPIFAIENNNGALTNYSYGYMYHSNNKAIFFASQAGAYVETLNMFTDNSLYLSSGVVGGAFVLRTTNATVVTPRLTITGGVATAVATWSNVTHSGFVASAPVTFLNATALPEADPHVAGQLYQIVATHVVMVSAG